MSYPEIKLKCESCGAMYGIHNWDLGEPNRFYCYSCAKALDHEEYGNVSYIAHEQKPVRTVAAELTVGCENWEREDEPIDTGNLMNQLLN